MRVIEDIIYVERPSASLALDLYLPDGTAHSTVLHAHGGGFFKGHRAGPRVPLLAQRLTDLGLAFASVSYRLGTPASTFNDTDLRSIRQNCRRARDQGVLIAKRMLGPAFEAARQDIGTAIAFLTSTHATHDIETSKLVLLGISAGGIAGLSLAYPPENLPCFAKPDAVITLGAAMVHPWCLSERGPQVLMLHSVNDKIIPPSTADLALTAATTSAAPFKVFKCNRKGHNAPVVALLKDTDERGTSYWDHMVATLQSAKVLSPTRGDV
ncbi:hypothetical protein [Shimia abyssi]|uniref:Alpha/beta hydrolase family protein n=1 Tax=Shimia abyssi TaxID=1662395 RepID=A0A2P8F6I3_9RHOB|nr:hypothetical protein [Shimia abyssi]PSL17330.1 hypothetical protein CLV88_1185 [Shimia abyssi]